MNVIQEAAKEAFDGASRARALLATLPVEYLGEKGVSDPGEHYSNYTNMISNRIISLYDDCALLLDNNRIPAACVIARCVMETYAVGELSQHDIEKSFTTGGIEKAFDTVLQYINSSRLKVEEQKRLKAGTFSADDYHFTSDALQRMTNEESVSKHILNAMRHLFGREMAITGQKESRFEQTYEVLCEWTHPSQTSLFHAYAERTWMVPTSIGSVSIWDSARLACATGLHFVAAIPELRENMAHLANQLSQAFRTSQESKPT